MAAGRPVVVGVDGSQGSDTAVRWAAREARRRDLPLRVVHATVPTHLPAMRSTAVATTTEWKRQAQRIAAEGAAAARRIDPTLAVEVKVRLNENPEQALADEADSAELLVLGARGSGGFAKLRLGSTAVQVLEVTPGPVVVVREPDAEVMPGPAAGQVVVGVDGSELSHRAARFGFGEAALRGTGLTPSYTRGPGRGIPPCGLLRRRAEWTGRSSNRRPRPHSPSRSPWHDRVSPA